MAEGVRAASVWASFGVTTKEWTKGLSKMVDQTVKTLKQIEGVGSKLGGLGAVWGASLGAAIAVASDSSPQLKSALDEIKNAGLDMAAEIGVAMLPMVKALASAIREAATFIQTLNPEIKAGAAEVAGYGTAALLAAGALGKFSGYGAAALEGMKVAVSGVSSAFKGLGLLIGGISAPVLVVIGVIAALVLAAGAFYKAWNTAGNGFKETVMSILDTVMGWGAAVGDFFVGLWNGIKDFITKAATFLLDIVAANIRNLAKLLAPVAEFLKLDGAAAFLQEMQGVTGEKLLSGIQAGAEWVWEKTKVAADYLADKAVMVGTVIGDGLMYAVDGTIQMAKDMAAKLPGPWADGLNNGKPAVQRADEHADEIRKIMAETRRALLGIDKDVAGRQRDFANVGKSPEELLKQATAGFGNFDHALASYSTRMRDYELMMQQVRLLEVKGRKDEAAALQVNAEAMRDSAERAGEAANGFKTVAQNLASKVAAAVDGLKNKFASALGPVSGLIESAQMGMTAGGPWGAVGALAADLLSQSSQFGQLIEMVTGFISVIADTLGQALVPILPILGQAFSLVATILDTALTPVIQMIVAPLESLSPILLVLVSIFDALAPLLKILISAALAILQPFWLLNPIMEGLFFVLKYVGVGIVWVATQIAHAWNAVVGAIQWVLRKIAEVPVFEFMNGWADSLNTAVVSTDAMTDAMNTLANTSFEAAKASAQETAAKWQGAEAAQALSESLSNVPSGIKVAALRFNSSDPLGGNAAAAATLAANRDQLTETHNYGDIHITVNGGDPDEIIAAIEQHQKRRSLRLTGSKYSLKR